MTAQVDDPTNGVAIIRQVMDLTQNTTTSGITKIGGGTSDDSNRDAGMDANTTNKPDRDGTSLGETDS